jgi:hypothetical protein
MLLYHEIITEQVFFLPNIVRRTHLIFNLLEIEINQIRHVVI